MKKLLGVLFVSLCLLEQTQLYACRQPEKPFDKAVEDLLTSWGTYFERTTESEEEFKDILISCGCYMGTVTDKDVSRVAAEHAVLGGVVGLFWGQPLTVAVHAGVSQYIFGKIQQNSSSKKDFTRALQRGLIVAGSDMITSAVCTNTTNPISLGLIGLKSGMIYTACDYFWTDIKEEIIKPVHRKIKTGILKKLAEEERLRQERDE